jgi:hypothetical protein
MKHATSSAFFELSRLMGGQSGTNADLPAAKEIPNAEFLSDVLSEPPQQITKEANDLPSVRL